MTSERKLILYIAMSLDGYIAKPNDDLEFLSVVAHEGEDYGYAEFVSGIDTVLIGRKTYEKVISMGYEFPHADKEVYVITRQSIPNSGNTKFYSGNLKELVLQLKSQSGKGIYCDGGAEIVHELLKENLIDEFYISIVPILLGEGISLFKQHRPELNLKLSEVKSFDKGLVQLHYKKIFN